MSDSRNKGVFQVSSWCWLDFMAAISPSVGKPPLCSHFRRIGNSSSTWKKASFIFYWNQLHWTFYQVPGGFNFHTSNSLFCLHFEIFGCCFNPLIYLPGSAWWDWRSLARKAKRQKARPSWAESWGCTYCKYFSLSLFMPCQTSDVCQEGKAGFPGQLSVLYHLLVPLTTSPLYCSFLAKTLCRFLRRWGQRLNKTVPTGAPKDGSNFRASVQVPFCSRCCSASVCPPRLCWLWRRPKKIDLQNRVAIYLWTWAGTAGERLLNSYTNNATF